jgi:hypothetical protein
MKFCDPQKKPIRSIRSLLMAQEVFGGGGQGGMNMDDIFSQFGISLRRFGGFGGGGGGVRRAKGSTRIKVKLTRGSCQWC